MEEAMIATCAAYGVETARVPGRSGVWLRAGGGRPERKIGAIGIRVSRGVTMHGIALNCDVDMSWYDRFVPCGISDAGVTSLSAELGRDVPVTEVLPVLQGELEQMLRWEDYTATPDYEARPEPGRAAVGGPRVEVLSRPGA
jgi:lipoyl(octanoyl) transferase